MGRRLVKEFFGGQKFFELGKRFGEFLLMRERVEFTQTMEILDDLDFLPGQVESPSQISQRTVSVSSETEDTLAGVPAFESGVPR